MPGAALGRPQAPALLDVLHFGHVAGVFGPIAVGEILDKGTIVGKDLPLALILDLNQRVAVSGYVLRDGQGDSGCVGIGIGISRPGRSTARAQHGQQQNGERPTHYGQTRVSAGGWP